MYYRCRQCEDGNVLSSSKTSCVPDNNCARGTGPPLNKVGNSDDCVACSDDNCTDCSGVFYWCNVCDSGYHADGGNCVQNLLY